VITSLPLLRFLLFFFDFISNLMSNKILKNNSHDAGFNAVFFSVDFSDEQQAFGRT
jgi:hypothetical protein